MATNANNPNTQPETIKKYFFNNADDKSIVVEIQPKQGDDNAISIVKLGENCTSINTIEEFFKTKTTSNTATGGKKQKSKQTKKSNKSRKAKKSKQSRKVHRK